MTDTAATTLTPVTPAPAITPTPDMLQENVRSSVQHRRMAWVAMAVVTGVLLLDMFAVPSERLGAINNVLTWFFTIFGSIIGANLGLVGWANIQQSKQ